MRTTAALILALMCVYLAESCPSAQGAIYAKFDGVDGESTAQGYEDYIPIESFAVGFARSSSDGGRARGVTRMTNFEMTAETGVQSVPLTLGMLTGRIYRKLELSITAGLGDGTVREFARWTLENLLLTRLEQSSQDPSSAPIDYYAVDAERLTYDFWEWDDKGGVKGQLSMTFDFAAGTASEVNIVGSVSNFVFATGSGMVSSPLDADFDRNGQVDAADFSDPAWGWEANFGSLYDGTDFLAWQRERGAASEAFAELAAQSVPEPSALLLAVGAVLLASRRGMVYHGAH